MWKGDNQIMLKRRMRMFFLCCIMLFVFLISVKAQDGYPLVTGERILEETIIDQDHVEIFTQVDDEFYFKQLEKNEEQWVINSSEIIQPRWTGLEFENVIEKGDQKLSAAIQSEIESSQTGSIFVWPSSVDYSTSEFLPPVGTQYENSCVAWATGYYLRTFQEAKDLNWVVKENGIGVESHIFSSSFIYNQINDGADKGATIVDSANLLKDIGAVSLQEFPYIPGDYYTKPNQTVIQSAYPHRIREWKLLCSKNDSQDAMIEITKQYLSTGDLVVAGSKIGFKFQYPDTDAYGNSIITLESNPSFMHAFIIVGYNDQFVSDDGLGAFKVMNSWGREWGNAGFSYLSYKAYAANLLEGYVFTDLVETNLEVQELDLQVNDEVDFDINFAGSGRYDFTILDVNKEMIYQEVDLEGKPGINTITWDGKDVSEDVVANGEYEFVISMSIDGLQTPLFHETFYKTSKVESANSYAYTNEGLIEYVEVPVDFTSAGILKIEVIYDGISSEVVANETVEANQHKVYSIPKDVFDFNNKDLDKILIKIDIQ